jgi:hypothetical protein
MLNWKVDYAATIAAGFKDKRSRKTLPDKNGVSHDILHGQDKRDRFREVQARAKGICDHCGNATPVDGFNRGSWHHTLCEHNDFKKCDCLESASWRHLQTCHLQLEHPQVQLGRIPE